MTYTNTEAVLPLQAWRQDSLDGKLGCALTPCGDEFGPDRCRILLMADLATAASAIDSRAVSARTAGRRADRTARARRSRHPPTDKREQARARANSLELGLSSIRTRAGGAAVMISADRICSSHMCNSSERDCPDRRRPAARTSPVIVRKVRLNIMLLLPHKPPWRGNASG